MKTHLIIRSTNMLVWMDPPWQTRVTSAWLGWEARDKTSSRPAPPPSSNTIAPHQPY